MKKTVVTIVAVVAVLLILFVPIPKGTLLDGGTRDYAALTYRIVVWNKLIAEANPDGSAGETQTYHKTSVFWFPDNYKSIDKLWKIERSGAEMDNTEPGLSAPKEQKADYYGLDASGGLDVIVWQMAPNLYSFGLLEHSEKQRDWLVDDLIKLKGVNADTMRTVLSSYPIGSDDVYIIPWQNQISSYIGEYWVRQKDESEESVEKRRQEYIDNIRHMLFDDVPDSPEKLPEDFSFSIVWGCYGISSYDSKTGRLVKTKDATDVSKYTCIVRLTDDQLIEVYHLLTDINIFSYPDLYDPFNAPDAENKLMSSPNQSIILSVTADGRTKTVSCESIPFGSLDDCYCNEAREFLYSINKIVELLTSLPEWAAFPEYEFFYD